MLGMSNVEAGAPTELRLFAGFGIGTSTSCPASVSIA
jgi:hypothetical protein